MAVRPSLLLVASGLVACRGELDAGYDVPHGALPVDERCAIVMVNDGARDNWQGEYATVLAATKQLQLVAIVVNESDEYPSLETNVAGYTALIDAAKQSGMRYLPTPTGSHAEALVQPSSGRIEDTVANGSAGAQLMVDAAKRWGSAIRPLTIATGGALTDVADAYLLDPSLAERVVVVASLGQASGTGASLTSPNGYRDEWATFIVISRLPYVQVNGYYDQIGDIPEERAASLPQNAFGAWLADKRADILDLAVAADQVSVLAAALPGFALDVTRMRVNDADATVLDADPRGPIWHVGRSDSDLARETLWSALTDADTFR